MPQNQTTGIEKGGGGRGRGEEGGWGMGDGEGRGRGWGVKQDKEIKSVEKFVCSCLKTNGFSSLNYAKFIIYRTTRAAESCVL